MLPILVVLFLISYGLMSMLVVEQGRTIDSQRSLIRELFNDSVELSSIKGRVAQKKNADAAAAAKGHAEADSHSKGQVQNPGLQAPSSQAPSVQVPPAHAAAGSAKSANGTERDSAKVEGNTGKLRKRAQKPPSYTTDTADERRALSST